MMATGLPTQLGTWLWPTGPRRDIWMLADAARERRVYGLLLECFYSTHICLYSDKLTPELKTVAPYLVPLDQESSKTQKFIHCAWGNSWGVLLKCDKGPDTLKRHLRGFLKVRNPQGRRMLFRFYDPRVLRTYLPTCTSEELASFFGPIECFWIESETPETMLEFRLTGGNLVQRTLSLAPGAFYPVLEEPSRRGSTPASPSRSAQEWPRIRPAQMQAFSQAEVRKFERWMCAHLRKHFAPQCQALSDAHLRELIGYGIERAARHQITTERDVCKFIDLMLVFGRDFDTDAGVAWAAPILETGRTAGSKIRALYAAAESHMGRS
jgi:hypothetical protein